MANGLRKSTRPGKRPAKYEDEPPLNDPEDSDLPSPPERSTRRFPIYMIFDERLIGSQQEKEYHVLWAGVDPKTSEPWPTSWVKKCDIKEEFLDKFDYYKSVRPLYSPLAPESMSLPPSLILS